MYLGQQDEDDLSCWSWVAMPAPCGSYAQATGIEPLLPAGEDVRQACVQYNSEWAAVQGFAGTSTSDIARCVCLCSIWSGSIIVVELKQ